MIRLEIAHVLFLDVVGYSKRSIDDQRRAIERLNNVVQATRAYQESKASQRLASIPTGDGMALVFYDSPEAPVECAMEISRQLSASDAPPVRMGIHSGPVSGVVDVNGRGNVAGEGINTAQRVMSCGDAGHILLSKASPRTLLNSNIGVRICTILVCEVKHGVRISLVNFFTSEIGNSDRPAKLENSAQATAALAPEPKSKRPFSIALGAIIVLTLFGALIFGGHNQRRRR